MASKLLLTWLAGVSLRCSSHCTWNVGLACIAPEAPRDVYDFWNVIIPGRISDHAVPTLAVTCRAAAQETCQLAGYTKMAASQQFATGVQAGDVYQASINCRCKMTQPQASLRLKSLPSQALKKRTLLDGWLQQGSCVTAFTQSSNGRPLTESTDDVRQPSHKQVMA